MIFVAALIDLALMLPLLAAGAAVGYALTPRR